MKKKDRTRFNSLGDDAFGRWEVVGFKRKRADFEALAW
jgi:hypothetical protein